MGSGGGCIALPLTWAHNTPGGGGALHFPPHEPITPRVQGHPKVVQQVMPVDTCLHSCQIVYGHKQLYKIFSHFQYHNRVFFLGIDVPKLKSTINLSSAGGSNLIMNALHHWSKEVLLHDLYFYYIIYVTSCCKNK